MFVQVGRWQFPAAERTAMVCLTKSKNRQSWALLIAVWLLSATDDPYLVYGNGFLSRTEKGQVWSHGRF